MSTNRNDKQLGAINRDLCVEELAALHSLDPETIRRKLRMGQFPGAWKIGRQWRIPTGAVAAFKEANSRTFPDATAQTQAENRSTNTTIE